MTPEDNRRAAKVMLIGTTMREKLFGEVEPVGATVRIRDVPFTVIGLLDRKGQSVWGDDQDDVALVPLTTARRQFVGTSPASPRLVHNITVKFADGVSAEDTMAAIRDLLRQRHRLQPGQEETFLVSNLAEAANVEQTGHAYAVASARGRGFGVACRWRHRNYEHHAGDGGRAHPGDRAAACAWRASMGHAVAVPHGSNDAGFAGRYLRGAGRSRR